MTLAYLGAGVLAVLLSARPEPPGDELILAHAELPALDTAIQQVLPAPPALVVRKTTRYGTVIIDHRRHLAARAPCRECHGPGVVSKVTLGSKVAHDKCVGCHKSWERGPTNCAGCHVKTVASSSGDTNVEGKPPEEKVPVAKAGPAGGGASDKAAEKDAMAETARVAASAPSVVLPSPRQLVELGFLADGALLGGSLRFSSRRGHSLRTYSLERLSGQGTARILMLLGFGITRSFRSFEVLAVALGGFDAQEEPLLGLSPSLGARMGVGWSFPSGWMLASVQLSITGVTAVSPAHAMGRQDGGPRAFATLAVGFAGPRN